jgi:hypothetical protein
MKMRISFTPLACLLVSVVFVGGVFHAEPVTLQQNPNGSPGEVSGPESNRVVIPGTKGPETQVRKHEKQFFNLSTFRKERINDSTLYLEYAERKKGFDHGGRSRNFL